MKKIFILAVCVFFAAAIAYTEEYFHDDAGISMWFPDSWEVSIESQNYIFATHPTGEVGILYLVFDADEIETKLDALDKELENLVDDLEMIEDSMSEETLNGMNAMVTAATGTAGGIPVNIGVILVATPNEKVLLIVGMIEAEKYDEHEKILDEILGRVKPL
ncbi:MAG: hypothetical protein JW904_04275 [Spirochaetales bacterium]|nr:hypothetical protein [Spirochaetales bacterium]